MPAGALAAIGQRLAATGAVLLVNDRVDLAHWIDAAGAHLPADGLPTPIARRLLGDERLLGRSTHSPEEARAACDEGADYVFLGPIWQTASHPDRAPLGPAAITAALPATVIAIGGVTPSRAPLCHQAGAYGAAAVRALWQAADPAEAARRILLSFAS